MRKKDFLSVSALKAIMRARAVGQIGVDSPYPTDDPFGRETSANAYIRLRAGALAIKSIRAQLPMFVEECRDLDSFWEFIQPKFKHYSERRAFLEAEFAPALSKLEEDTSLPTESSMAEALSVAIDWEYVQTSWTKALDRRVTDPEAAVTTARTLLETVCKHILDEAGAAYASDGKIEPLLDGAIAQVLADVPPLLRPGTDRALRGCKDIVLGIGTLRNKAGDSHGKGKTWNPLEPKQAELVVNLAGAVSAFLIQSWASRLKSKP